MNPLKWPLILTCCGFILCAPPIADAQTKPDKRLLQKVSVQWEEKPIKEGLPELCEKHKLPVEFDSSFTEEGFDSATFSLTADGITLGSLVHLICKSLQLVSTVEKGKLLILTRAADEEKLITREYSLAALGGNISPQLFSMNLVGMTSGRWMEVDQEGGEVLAISPQAISIRHNRTVHEEVQNLLDQIATVSGGKARAATPQDRAEQLILRKLQTPALPPADVTTLPEILEQVLQKNGIPYWIDEMAMKDEKIEWKDLTSKLDVKKVATSRRLDSIAAEHRLSWKYEDEVVQITTLAKLADVISIRVYDVRNKLSPTFPSAALAQQLIANKDLGAWMVSDGHGGCIFPIGTSLLIAQEGAGHEKIAKLLK